MRTPRNKGWFTVLVIVFALMLLTGAAYATSPGTLGVVGTIGVQIDPGDEEVLFPGGPFLPGFPGLNDDEELDDDEDDDETDEDNEDETDDSEYEYDNDDSDEHDNGDGYDDLYDDGILSDINIVG